MAAWIPLITQLIPLILPVIAPFALQFFQWGMGALGKVIPAGVLPVANAVLGGVLSYAAGSDPTIGAVTAHIVRSGLVHEPPVVATPTPTPPPT